MSMRPRYLRRDQLVDRGVDRRVLAADAGAGDEPEEQQRPVVPGQAAEPAADEVDGQGDDEELLAAELVGQPAEEQRTDDLADQVARAEEADLARRQVQGSRLTQDGADQRDDLDLEPVQDPGDAEADDDEPVEPGPGQAVHPGRHQTSGDRLLIRTVCGCRFLVRGRAHVNLPSPTRSRGFCPRMRPKFTRQEAGQRPSRCVAPLERRTVTNMALEDEESAVDYGRSGWPPREDVLDLGPDRRSGLLQQHWQHRFEHVSAATRWTVALAAAGLTVLGYFVLRAAPGHVPAAVAADPSSDAHFANDQAVDMVAATAREQGRLHDFIRSTSAAGSCALVRIGDMPEPRLVAAVRRALPSYAVRDIARTLDQFTGMCTLELRAADPAARHWSSRSLRRRTSRRTSSTRQPSRRAPTARRGLDRVQPDSRRVDRHFRRRRARRRPTVVRGVARPGAGRGTALVTRAVPSAAELSP